MTIETKTVSKCNCQKGIRTINISANREMERIHLNRFNYRLPIKSNLSLFTRSYSLFQLSLDPFKRSSTHTRVCVDWIHCMEFLRSLHSRFYWLDLFSRVFALSKRVSLSNERASSFDDCTVFGKSAHTKWYHCGSVYNNNNVSLYLIHLVTGISQKSANKRDDTFDREATQ